MSLGLAPREKFVPAFANAAIGFLPMTTPAGRFLRCQPGGHRALTGYSLEELRTLEPSGLVHPEGSGDDSKAD